MLLRCLAALIVTDAAEGERRLRRSIFKLFDSGKPPIVRFDFNRRIPNGAQISMSRVENDTPS